MIFSLVTALENVNEKTGPGLWVLGSARVTSNDPGGTLRAHDAARIELKLASPTQIQRENSAVRRFFSAAVCTGGPRLDTEGEWTNGAGG